MTRCPIDSTLALSGLALALLVSAFPFQEAVAASPTDSEVTPRTLLWSTPGLDESLRFHQWQAFHKTDTLAEIITFRNKEICRTTVAIETLPPQHPVPGPTRRTFSIQDETACTPLEENLEHSALVAFPKRIGSQTLGALRELIETALPEDLCYPGLTLQLHLEGELPTSSPEGSTVFSNVPISMSPASISSESAPNAARECMESILPEKITLPLPNMDATALFWDQAPRSIHLFYQISFPLEESEQSQQCTDESEPSPVEVIPTSTDERNELFHENRCFQFFDWNLSRPVLGFLVCH